HFRMLLSAAQDNQPFEGGRLYIQQDLPKLTDKKVIALAEALTHNTSVKSLEISRSVGSWEYGDAAAEALARMIEQNQSLTSITLTAGQISDDGIARIAEAVKKNPRIRSLTLNKQNFGAKGAKAIAEMLEEHKHIENVDLGYNHPFGREGGDALAKGIRYHPSLKGIKLTEGYIGPKAGMTLVRAIATVPQMEVVGLESNKLEAEVLKQLAKSVKPLSHLVKLHVRYNEYGDEFKGDASVFDAFANVISARSHPNLVSVLGLRGAQDVNALAIDNSAAMRRLNKNRGSMETLSASKWYEVVRRLPALRRNYPAIAQEAEQVLERMPRPDHEQLSCLEDLLAPMSVEGFPGFKQVMDNPHVWKDFDEHLARFARKGERLSASQLLEEDRKTPSPLLQAVIDRNLCHCLFTEKNWLGKPAQEMREVYNALDDASKGGINVNGLAVIMQKHMAAQARRGTMGPGV
ncbi:MAG: hypothetical protein ACPG80_03695, partial [Rickettsiales bacterium]